MGVGQTTIAPDNKSIYTYAIYNIFKHTYIQQNKIPCSIFHI